MVTGAIIWISAFRLRTARSRLLVIGVAAFLSGCSTQVAGVVLPLFDSLTIVSWVSTAVSGKSLSEYALDALTGKDCSFIDGMLRADRRICEERGAPSTGSDFRGLAGLWSRDKVEAAGLAVAQAPAETPEAGAVLDAGGDDVVLVTAPLP